MLNSSRQEPRGCVGGGGEGGGGGRDNRQSPFGVRLPPLRTTISNHSEPFFRNPTMGFVYKDMYYIEPILSPPESSQAGSVLPRLYELSSLPVHPVAPSAHTSTGSSLIASVLRSSQRGLAYSYAANANRYFNSLVAFDYNSIIRRAPSGHPDSVGKAISKGTRAGSQS
jgi:hypothetical protein